MNLKMKSFMQPELQCWSSEEKGGKERGTHVTPLNFLIISGYYVMRIMRKTEKRGRPSWQSEIKYDIETRATNL